MKRRILLVVLLSLSILILPAVLHAGVAAYERYLARGVASLESGDAKSAAEEFRAADAEKPGDPQAALYLGIALARGGDPGAEAVLARAAQADPANPRIPFERGLLLLAQGRQQEAGRFFGETTRLAPGSDLARMADRYAAEAGNAAGPKRWNLDLGIGAQYDTNVVQNSSGSPLPGGISGKSDFRLVLQGHGDVRLLAGPTGFLAATYDHYRSFHDTLSLFNMARHQLGLEGGLKLSPSVSATAAYAFETVRVGNRQYEHAHIARPTLVFSEGEGFETILEYRWKKSFYKDSALFIGNKVRSGDDHQVGIVQTARAGAIADLRGGIRYGREHSYADYWNSAGGTGFVGATIHLPLKASLDLFGEYGHREYAGVYPGSGVERVDNVRTFSATAVLPLTPVFTVSAGHTYVNASSNIASFSYGRNVTSLLVDARF